MPLSAATLFRRLTNPQDTVAAAWLAVALLLGEALLCVVIISKVSCELHHPTCVQVQLTGFGLFLADSILPQHRAPENPLKQTQTQICVCRYRNRLDCIYAASGGLLGGESTENLKLQGAQYAPACYLGLVSSPGLVAFAAMA